MLRKIKETHVTPPQGMRGAQYTYVRVREVEVPDDKELHLSPDAILLPEGDPTPVSDWQPVEAP